MSTKRFAFGIVLVASMLGTSGAAHQVQPPPPAPSAPAAAPVAQRLPGVERVPLTAGRSTVLPTDFDITRIAVTNPAIADAVVVAAARGAHRRQEAPERSA